MKIVLPSLGVLGTRSVNLNPVRFSDIREIQNFSNDENLSRLELMHLLLPDTDFSKITRWDIEYLYTISIFSVLYGNISFDAVCPDCGEKIPSNILLEQLDIKQLDFTKKISKTIQGVKYTYNHVSAKQYEDALVYAQTCEDEQSGYEDYLVSCILNISIEKVHDLSALVYMSAFLFFEMSFHGMHLSKEIVCPKCKRSFKSIINVPLNTIKIDVTSIMSHFASVSDVISFDDFNNMTIPEYDNFIKSLNDRVEAQR